MSPFVRLLTCLCLALFAVVAPEPAKPSDSAISEDVIRDYLIKGLDAVSPKELDPLLAKLAALQKQTPPSLNYLDPNRILISYTAEILTAYQDGLLGAKSQKQGSAVERMQQSASGLSVNYADLLPRSELMEKIGAACGRISGASPPEVSLEKKVNDLIRGIKKLEDMDPVMEQIDALESRARQQGNPTNSQVTMLFRNYCSAYHELRDGHATSLQFAYVYGVRAGADVMVGIRDLLTHYALPRLLEPPADLVQKDGETTLEFLRRAIATARDTSNWPLLFRAVGTAQAMYWDTVVSYEERVGLPYFLGGLNQEQAHDWAGAVTSYVAALKSGSQLIPVEYIGKRLAEIRQQHPEDYDAGAKATPSRSGIEQRAGLPQLPMFDPRASPFTPSEKPASNEKPNR